MLTPKLVALPIVTAALTLFAACSATPEASAVPKAAPPEFADLLLLNARVHTLAWEEPSAQGKPAATAPRDANGPVPDAQAVAIKGSSIVAVGSSEALLAGFRGQGTRIVDLKGATIVPGLIDSHAHVAEFGQTLAMVNLEGVDTEDEAIRRIEERARHTPAGQWIEAWGFDEGAWANRMPNNTKLSVRVPHHPVHARGLHGFASWNNKLALERAGITSKTQSPPGGEIALDKQGMLTGVLLNNASDLFSGVIPEPTPEARAEATLLGLQSMAKLGFVAIHDAGVGRATLASYQRLEEQGRLPLRVYAMLAITDRPLMEEWILRGPTTDKAAMVRVSSVKAYYDASLGARGARLLADYSDKHGHRGVSGENYGFDQELAIRAMKAGFQLGIHAIGDAGNRETLDFFERAYSQVPAAREQRNRIEHAQIVHPDDQTRFGVLKIIAAMQPPHCVEDMVWAEARLGPERIRHGYAWRSLREKQARLAFSSDMSGSDPNPFYGLHAAITRQNKQRQPEGGWLSAESLSAEEALRGYTLWNAFASFSDDLSGTIAPGKWADLTVMDLDPLLVGEKTPGALLDGRVLMTIVAGKVAYSALATP